MTDTPRDAGPKQAAPTRPEKPAADFGYVGIDAILEQMRRKAMKQGFEFNIMVVGEFSPRASCPQRAQRVVFVLLQRCLSSLESPWEQELGLSVGVSALGVSKPCSQGADLNSAVIKAVDVTWPVVPHIFLRLGVRYS